MKGTKGVKGGEFAVPLKGDRIESELESRFGLPLGSRGCTP